MDDNLIIRLLAAQALEAGNLWPLLARFKAR